MKLRRTFPTAVVLIALVLAAPGALAADAQGFVKAKQTELTQLVKTSKTAAQDKKVEQAFDQVLDYDSLAQESLREFWKDLKPEEQKAFQETLTKLVRGAYRKSLKKIGDYNVEYKGAAPAQAGQVVRTVAKSRSDAREEPVSVDYVVREQAGSWRIVDIVTEGSSLVGNYRSQFRRIIKQKNGIKDGFPELLKRMKTRLEKGEA
ncbi:MAG TPA: ABC transporter substrate-binding protein [Polyangiaceae bacterium]|nr:ABC transporter substrate-binding protein [Polyangiaceae bacterium]